MNRLIGCARCLKHVHGRHLFAKPSFRDGLKVTIAPVHPDFCCETCSLSLMGSAAQRLNRLHALEVSRPARVVPITVLPVLPSLSDCPCNRWCDLRR